MKALLIRALEREDGQDLIEYGLLIGIITVASMLAMHGDRREGRAVLHYLECRHAVRSLEF